MMERKSFLEINTLTHLRGFAQPACPFASRKKDHAAWNQPRRVVLWDLSNVHK
jgi:hypothetical protein